MADKDVSSAIQRLLVELHSPDMYADLKGHALEVLEQFRAGLKEKTSPSYAQLAVLGCQCSLLRRYGIPPLLVLREASEALFEADIESCYGEDSLHSDLEPLLIPLAEGEFKSKDDLAIDVLADKLSGLVQYNPDNSSIEVTNKGTENGLNPRNLTSYATKYLAEEESVSCRKVAANYPVEALLNIAVTQKLANPTNGQILTRLADRHRDLSIPQLDLKGVEYKDWPAELDRHRELIKEFSAVYGNKDDSRVESLFATMLTAIAARSINPGATVQWYPVLRGPGGSGKTSLASGLAVNNTYVVSDAATLPKIDSLMGSSVLCLDEIDVLVRKRDITEFKSFVTQTQFRTRLAYRPDAQYVQASWFIIATTNAETIEGDDGAQNRRQAVIDIPGTVEDGEKRFQWLQANRDRLHALGVWLYRAGFSPNLSSVGVSEQTEQNSSFVEPTAEISDLNYRLDALKAMVTGPQTVQGFTHGQLWRLTACNDRRWHTRHTPELKRMLESRGWILHTDTDSRRKLWIPGDSQDLIVRPVHEDSLFTIRTRLAQL